MKNLYQQAFQYLNNELWKSLWDNQIFAVKFSDGEVGYCCVMGAAGTFCALGIYIGDEGINSYLKMLTGDFISTDDKEIKYSQNCIMCSFIKPSELDRATQLKTRTNLKNAGFDLKQIKLYPIFEKILKYHIPTTDINDIDKQHFEEAFFACSEVAKKLKVKSADELHITNERELLNKTIPYLICKKDGSYTWRTKKLPKDIFMDCYLAQDYNYLLAQKIKTMKPTDSTWLCGIFRFHSTIKDEEGIPYFPLVQVLLDKESEFMFNMQICKFEEHEETIFPNKLFDIIKEHGKPNKIILTDTRAVIIYNQLLNELGIDVDYQPNLKSINRVKLQLRNFK